MSGLYANAFGPGMAISPATPVEALLPFADRLDILLIMTVVPGRRTGAHALALVPALAHALALTRTHITLALTSHHTRTHLTLRTLTSHSHRT